MVDIEKALRDLNRAIRKEKRSLVRDNLKFKRAALIKEASAKHYSAKLARLSPNSI